MSRRCFNPFNFIHHWTSRHNFIRTWAETISINDLVLITWSHIKFIPSFNCHIISIFNTLIEVRTKIRTNFPTLSWLEIRNENVSLSWSDTLGSYNETCPSMFSVFFSITSASNSHFQGINVLEHWIVNWFLSKNVLKSIITCVFPVIKIH